MAKMSGLPSFAYRRKCLIGTITFKKHYDSTPTHLVVKNVIFGAGLWTKQINRSCDKCHKFLMVFIIDMILFAI